MNPTPQRFLNEYIIELIRLHESRVAYRPNRNESRYQGLRIWLGNCGVNVVTLLRT